MAGKGKVAVSALEAVVKAMAEAQPKLVRASEALAPHEGKTLKPLQYDRMRVNLPTNDLGGPEYSFLSLINDPHAAAGSVAAVSNKTALSKLVNQYKDMKPGSVIHTPQLGSEIQHRGNPTMFARIHNEVMDKIKKGEIDQEQIDVINNRLNSTDVGKKGKPKLLFPEPVDIASPEFRLKPYTFEQRSEFADVVSGAGIIKTLGKERGKMIDLTSRLGETIDPYIADAPTGALGHRIVELGTNTLYDPALHGDYPYHIIGKDMGVRFKPFEKEYMTDFAKQIMEDPKKARMPNDMDFRTGNVNQRITPEWLQILKDSGNKDGGSIHPDGSRRLAGGGSAKKTIQAILKRAKVAQKSTYELAHEAAQKNAVEMLGLHPENTAKDRARAMGFDVDNPVYHGTTSDIKEINPSKFGTSTDAYSGELGFWSTDDPLTAKSYADYAAYYKPTNKNPRLMHIPGHKVKARHPNRRQNIIPMYVNKNDMVSVDQKGLSWDQLMDDTELENKFSEILDDVKYGKGKVGEIKNFQDTAAGIPGKSATHYVSPHPSSYRSINAAFDPAEAESGDLLKAKGGSIKGISKALQVAIDAADLPPAANSARTQIVGTMPTYEKARDILRQEGIEGADVLDFGAGKGLGSTAMKAHSFEPYPQGWHPTYTQSKDIPSDEYKGLLNLNVLNVLSPEMRAHAVEEMGRVMRNEGTGLITTRGKDVMNTIGGRPGPEPMSVITSRDTYQKGYSPEELRAYIKHILGSDYEYEPLNLGAAGVKVKKKAEGGGIEDDTRSITQDPTGYLLNKVKPVSTRLDAQEFKKRIGSGNLLGRITGNAVSGVKGIADDTAQEVKRLKPQSAIDIPVNAAAEAIGFPMDIAEELNDRVSPIRSDIVAPKDKYLTPVKPLPLTSESLKQGAKDLGITSGEEFPNLQFASQFALPSVGRLGVKGAKAYGNLVKEGIERNIEKFEPRMNIIKDPGGMVVGGEKAIDEELLNMKKTENNFPHAHQYFVPEGDREALKDPNAVALNAWIDTKVKKYIRNQAGTKDDPILKSIESGVEHNFMPPQSGDTKYSIAMKREMVGKPKEGIATTEKGKDWEYAVDATFNPVKSKDIKEILSRHELPHTNKEANDKFTSSLLRMEHDLPIHTAQDLEALQLINQIPDENVYSMGSSNLTSRLGLNHVSDVLYEDLVSGKLTSEQLNQMSIEKAIRRTAEYDAQKAKEMAKASAQSVEGMPIPKAYDDGFKWVELKHPTEAEKTKGALKSEGEMMGHCVGSYCQDVLSGETQIFSLRGPDNKSHVTIEVSKKNNLNSWLKANEEEINKDPLIKQMHYPSPDERYPGQYTKEEMDAAYIGDITKMLRMKGAPVHDAEDAWIDIMQVKGKQNKRPDDKYQKYVSDFVKSNVAKHEITDIHELQNTNLMDVQSMIAEGLVPKELHFNPEITKALKARYPAFNNLMASDKEDMTYQLFKDIAKDFARKNQYYISNEDIIEAAKAMHLKKSKGGPIDLQQEYKLENMRRRYG